MASETGTITTTTAPVGEPGFEVWNGRLSPVTLIATRDPGMVRIAESAGAPHRLGVSVARTRAGAVAIARRQLAARVREAEAILAEVERIEAGLRD